MALNRAPTAIQVNGAALLVKGESSGLFSKFQRVPGLANFTLPDETGSTNEVQLMDGSVAFAQIAGVGTITANIGAITGHATHRYLAAKRRSGDQITVTIVRPAVGVEDFVANVAHDANGDVLTFTTATGKVKALAREGRLIAVGQTSDTLGGDMSGLVTYSGPAAASGNDHYYRPIVAVNDGGDKVKVEAGIATALTAAATNKVSIRTPGILYESILCTVNGFGDGDFQSGSALAANLSLQPAEALPELTTEWRILPSTSGTELSSANAFGTADSPFADLA